MQEKKSALFSRDVFRFRQMIYGASALWLMFFHANINLPLKGRWMLPAAFKYLGNCNVEVFLLLSAFGLYSSLSRNADLKRFYLRRMERVFLPSFLVAALFYGFTTSGTRNYIAEMTFLPYWFGANSLWFVSFILTMYLVYPLLFRLQKRCPAALLLLLAVSTAAVIVLESRHLLKTYILRIGVSRIPIFLLGCILAPGVARAEDARNRPVFWLSIALGIVAAVLCVATHPDNSVVHWVQAIYYAFISIAVIQLLTLLGHLLLRLGGLGRIVYKFLAYCGSISLECYLLFGRFDRIFYALLPQKIAMRPLRIAWLSGLCTLIVGYLLTRLCAALVRFVREIRLPE